MKLIQNTGTQRVIDLMRPHLKHGNRLDCVTPSFSLYAFAEIREALSALDQVQLIAPPDNEALELLGTESDRAARNRLLARWLANQSVRKMDQRDSGASAGIKIGAAEGCCHARLGRCSCASGPGLVCLQHDKNALLLMMV